MRLLDAGHLSETGRGPACAAIEEAFAGSVSSRYALSFNSGTASLHAALHAVGTGPGSAPVVVSPMTWISAITAVFHAGAVPVFCDIEPDSPNLSPTALDALRSPAAAVIVTHAWGIPARVDALAAAVSCPLIEDCSQAHGAIYRGRPVGSWGAAGCFSLQESKAVSAGEGGILTTSDRGVYERAMTVGHHPHRLAAELTGPDTAILAAAGASWKYRMPALNAVIGVEQLRRLPKRAAACAANYKVLAGVIRSAGLPIRLPPVDAGSVRGWYGTPIEFIEPVTDPHALRRALNAEGIPVRAAYDDWITTPILADQELAARFWPSARRYHPPEPGSLPNYQHARRQMTVLKIPGVAAADYMRDIAAALGKITAQWDRVTA
jgi:perosamine synthetase